MMSEIYIPFKQVKLRLRTLFSDLLKENAWIGILADKQAEQSAHAGL